MVLIEDLLHRRSDLSTFVVHFTRDNAGTSARDNLLSILRDRRLLARNTFGMAKSLAQRRPAVADSQRTVCFTETPLEHAWMMCQDIDLRENRFTGYGLAFTRTFARRSGANPVWYLDMTKPAAGYRDFLTNAINQLVTEAEGSATTPGATTVDDSQLAAAPILRLTPFLEQMGNSGGTRKEFWWEREWRHVGDFSFAPTDIVVVFAPTLEHDEIRARLVADPTYNSAIPALVDATWGLERMIGALSGVADVDPFPK